MAVHPPAATPEPTRESMATPAPSAADMAAYDDRESARILAASPAQAAAAPAPRDCGFMGVFCLELPEVHVDIDVHTALDVVGMIPVIGTGADVINAGLYAAEGDYVNAGLSLASSVPLVGDALGAGKLAAKYGDDVAGLVAGHADEAAAAVSDAAHFGDDAAAVASSTAKVADDAASGAVTRTAGDIPTGASEITLEAAAAAASRNGIDMRMFDLVKKENPGEFGSIGVVGKQNPKVARTESGRFELSITSLGLRSALDAVETIAHELNHVRGVLMTGRPTSEGVAEVAAQLAGLFYK